MAEQMEAEQGYYVADVSTKVRDLEEKARLLKDRVVLIGQNLIESKESLGESVQDLKTNLEALKADVGKVKEKIQLILEEMDSFPRREEVALLKKQFKMFEPLQFARIEDVESIVQEKMNAMVEDQNDKKESSFEKDKRGYIF